MEGLSPALLISGVIISTIGLFIFMRGKREVQMNCLIVGIGMMVFPYFVHSVLLMWGMGAACIAGLWLVPGDG